MTFGHVASCDDTFDEGRMACRAHTTLYPAVGGSLNQMMDALDAARADGWSFKRTGNRVQARCPSHGRALGLLVAR